MKFSDSEERYGQSFLCVSTSTDDLDSVAEAYLIDGVNVFDGDMSAAMQKKIPKFVQNAF